MKEKEKQKQLLIRLTLSQISALDDFRWQNRIEGRNQVIRIIIDEWIKRNEVCKNGQ